MKNWNHLILAMAMIFGLVGSQDAFSQKSKESKSKSKQSETIAEDLNSQKNEEEGTSTQSTTAPKEIQGTLNSHSKEIQKIIKNEKGVIRGIDFGTPVQKIKETEDALYVADGKDFIIYNVPVNEKEKAEIIYYLDEQQKVKGFGIAFLVNAALLTNDIEATLIDDFQKYFNERYGKFITNDKNDDVWTSKDGSYTLEMGDSSEGPELSEIEIEIFKKK